jgi:hypothetical protein
MTHVIIVPKIQKLYLPFLTNVRTFTIYVRCNVVRYTDFAFLVLNAVHDGICMIGKDIVLEFQGIETGLCL